MMLPARTAKIVRLKAVLACLPCLLVWTVVGAASTPEASAEGRWIPGRDVPAHLNPMPFEAAAEMERDLADDLRRAGYTATGVH